MHSSQFNFSTQLAFNIAYNFIHRLNEKYQTSLFFLCQSSAMIKFKQNKKWGEGGGGGGLKVWSEIDNYKIAFEKKARGHGLMGG